jgi:hypothetical protein
MKAILLSILSLLCMCGLFAEANHIKYNVHQHSYTFSKVFDLQSEEECYGTVVKSVFRVRTHYDVYGPLGEYEATGICRPALGLLYVWATVINVYDDNGNWIGKIDGDLITGGLAKFSIYNQDNNRVAIAYLERGASSFDFVSPDNENFHIAHMKRHFVEDAIDHWSVIVHDRKVIDERILKVFSGFAIDSQKYFKEDT